jgi:hypothetical protein
MGTEQRHCLIGEQFYQLLLQIFYWGRRGDEWKSDGEESIIGRVIDELKGEKLAHESA